ncbi:MAG: DegV family protein [Anaerolineaceae bacterium]|nr:DegV family protein [Anaerolineaceae bacterium]
MSKIAIITDTDANLPASLAAQYKIQQVPILINFDDRSYSDGIDIDNRVLFEHIDELGKLPSTAAPAPGAFASAYQAAFEAGAESVVCICVSSKISATYSSAVTACNDFPGQPVTVVDSLNLSMGQGFMVLAAAKAAAAGADHDEVVARARSVGERLHVFGSLSTLKYLAMSGRVGKVAAAMGTMFNIRPILSVQGGKLELLERVRTRKQSIARLVELIQEAVDGKQPEQIAFIHVNNLEDAAYFETQLRASLPLPEDTLTVEFSPGLSVHTGSGMIGIAIVTGE